MGMTKKDLEKNAKKIKSRIAELEEECKMDPVRRFPMKHEELAMLKKKLAEG